MKDRKIEKIFYFDRVTGLIPPSQGGALGGGCYYGYGVQS